MLNHTKDGLLIFDQFRQDRTLKKFRKENESSLSFPNDIVWSSNMGSVMSVPSSSGFRMNDVPDVSMSVGQQQADFKIQTTKEIFRRLCKFLFGWLIPTPKPKITVQEFFTCIKTELKKPEVYADRINGYLKIANEAKNNGQTALFEQLSRDINIVKLESQLLAAEFGICITEEQVVKFYKESEKGLSLTYVENFTRVIPNEVIKRKVIADDLLVFDNYVILHYDPKQTAFRLTQTEIIKKRDPILFGLISGNRKLYYIADWIDEYCDLTLKDFIDKFGEEAIRANDISVNYVPAVQ